MFDAFKKGDTNNDGIVDGTDIATSANDLDGDGVVDFQQVFNAGGNLASDANRLEVNSDNTRAYIWVDGSQTPNVTIHSRGNPLNTTSVREISLALSTSAQALLSGALNNAP